MIDLTKRTDQKELLDGDNIPFEDIKMNMRELNTINTLLGGHSITIKGIQYIIENKRELYTICEMGCGGGDNLMIVADWCKKNNISARFIGIDIKPECIAFCKERFSHSDVEWICSDYRKINFENKPSILFSSLFCHHFSNEQLAEMLQWMKVNSTTGFFINDLERNMLAYYSIKFLTGIFSKSYLVKNDAPLSVARGFLKCEWIKIFQQANVNCVIEWKWAFRHLITFKNAG